MSTDFRALCAELVDALDVADTALLGTDRAKGAKVVRDALHRARAALAVEAVGPPRPIPVATRLPGAEDCDSEGRCWWWYPPVPEQTYGYWAHEDDAVPERALDEQPTHWLPAHALPIPTQENADVQ